TVSKFSINLNAETEVDLEPGIYSLDDIIDGFNENFESEECGVHIAENEGFITIKHDDDEVFDMDCSGDDSIGFMLGFDKKKYTGSSRYTSEKRHAFNEKPIFMYIRNINKSKAFAKINPDGSFEQY